MAFSYRWSDLITLTSKQVKNIPTQQVDALHCDLVSSRIAGRLGWKPQQQTIADGQIPLVNGVQDYDPPFQIWRLTDNLSLRCLSTTPNDDINIAVRDSLPVDLYPRSPYAITSVSLQAGVGQLRLSSAPNIQQGQVWELRGQYQIDPTKVISTDQFLWFDDRYVYVALEGLTYWYFRLADDPRAGTTTGNWPGDISYSGQLAQFMSAIKEMADAEDIGGDMQVFPDDALGISSSQYGAMWAGYGTGGGGTTPVPPVGSATLTLNASSVPGGNTTFGTVTLAAATSVDTVVNLSSSNPAAATVPASIIIPAGQKTNTFTVTTSPVAANTSLVIWATVGSTTLSASLTVTAPAVLSSVNLNPATVAGGSTSVGTVYLSSPAPAGGAVVSLSSSNTSAATVPASVTVAANQTTATFNVATLAVSASTSVTISGSYGGTQSATLTVTVAVAVTLSSITLNPNFQTGGQPSVGTATLSGPAPAGGALVTLSSDNTAVAQVPGGVTVPAGQTSATFNVTTTAVSANTTAHISGTYGTTQSASLTLAPPPQSIYGGPGQPGATSTVTAGTGNTVVLSTGDVLPRIKTSPEVIGDSWSITVSNQCIYLFLVNAGHAFVDANTGFSFAFNAPIAVTFQGLPMFLYQSSNPLTGTYKPKVTS